MKAYKGIRKMGMFGVVAMLVATTMIGMFGMETKAEITSGWQWVRQITLSNTITDYAIKFRIYENDSTRDDPVNGTIDLAGKCENFPNDIRFGTTDDPSTANILPQWIEKQGIATPTLTEYSGNPVFSGGDGQTYARFGSVWKEDTWYLFYEYEHSIYYVTSADGIHWGTTPTLCISPSTSGWDSNSVTVPIVWKENGRWYMIYRGDDGTTRQIGLAWSDDLQTWTKSPNNPILQPSASGWDSTDVEQNNIIKVDNTYYLWYNNMASSPNRYTGLATTTEAPEHWSNANFTRDPNNPIITDGVYGDSFCGSVFKYGSYYYMINAGRSGRIKIAEMWRSTTPTFYDREYMGIVYTAPDDGSNWEYMAPDVISPVTDDITRSSYTVTNGELWFYYTGATSSAWDTAKMGIFIIHDPDTWLNDEYVDVWVKLPDTAQDSIYLFAGNPSATEYSSGDDVFLFFDDFENTIDWENKWQSTNQSAYSIEDGKLVMNAISDANGLICTKNAYGDGVSFEALIRNGAPDGVTYLDPNPQASLYDSDDILYITYYDDPPKVRSKFGGVYTDTTITEDTSKYYRCAIKIPSSGEAISEVYEGDTLIHTYTGMPSYRTNYLSFFQYRDGAGYVDWVFVRKYASQEPAPTSYSDWSSVSEGNNLVADFTYSIDVKAVMVIDNSQHTNDIVNYTWDFGDGSIDYGESVTHYYDDYGIYNITLTITDSEGNTDSVTKTVNVRHLADFTYTINDKNVTFTALYEADSYIWNFGYDGDGNGLPDILMTTNTTVTYTYNDYGSYEVTLQAYYDDNNSNDEITKTITLSPANTPPATPSNPSPSNGATGIILNPTLMWQCSDPDGDSLTYDVYFGTSADSLSKIATTSSNSYQLQNLSYETTYYWKIVASDGQATSESPVWHFTTKSSSSTSPVINVEIEELYNGVVYGNTSTFNITVTNATVTSLQLWFGQDNNLSLIKEWNADMPHYTYAVTGLTDGVYAYRIILNGGVAEKYGSFTVENSQIFVYFTGQEAYKTWVTLGLFVVGLVMQGSRKWRRLGILLLLGGIGIGLYWFALPYIQQYIPIP